MPTVSPIFQRLNELYNLIDADDPEYRDKMKRYWKRKSVNCTDRELNKFIKLLHKEGRYNSYNISIFLDFIIANSKKEKYRIKIPKGENIYGIGNDVNRKVSICLFGDVSGAVCCRSKNVVVVVDGNVEGSVCCNSKSCIVWIMGECRSSSFLDGSSGCYVRVNYLEECCEIMSDNNIVGIASLNCELRVLGNKNAIFVRNVNKVPVELVGKDNLMKVKDLDAEQIIASNGSFVICDVFRFRKFNNAVLAKEKTMFPDNRMVFNGFLWMFFDKNKLEMNKIAEDLKKAASEEKSENRQKKRRKSRRRPSRKRRGRSAQ